MAPVARPPASRMSRPSEDTAKQPSKPNRRRKLVGASLVAGSVLLVASVATSAATRFYSISYGETLNSIARDHGTDVATLIGLNDDIEDPDLIIAGDRLQVPAGDLISYTVREGDTLNKIAALHGVTVKELVVINKLDDPDLIRPGEVLLMYIAEEGDADMVGVDDEDDVEAEAGATRPAPTATEADSDEPTDDEETAAPTAEPADEEEAAEDASGDEGESDGAATDDEATAEDEGDDEAAEDGTGDGIGAPSISGQLHLVQNDETLADIAAQYGVTEAQIIAANALESAAVSNGMILKIPAAASEGVELIGMPLGREQWPLMSEIAAASLATAYWGAPVSPEELLAALEPSDNPHYGFRGDPMGMFGGTDDYGVYADALAQALAGFGFDAEAFYAEGDPSALTARLDAGTPVVVWVTYNLTPQERQVVEDESGRYSLVPEQHAVVVYGYTDEGVKVVDLSSGAAAVWDWEPFMASWSLFDGMGLAIDLR